MAVVAVRKRVLWREWGLMGAYPHPHGSREEEEEEEEEYGGVSLSVGSVCGLNGEADALACWMLGMPDASWQSDYVEVMVVTSCAGQYGVVSPCRIRSALVESWPYGVADGRLPTDIASRKS